MKLLVRAWTREEFSAGQDVWQQMLARSDADPLFMSWDWIHRWWAHHESELQGQLQILAVYGGSGELHGIAPFYLHRGSHLELLGVQRLELLGNAWRHPRVVFSEYLDIIARKGSQAEVCEALLDHLSSTSWDEIVLCNLRPDSVAGALARALAGQAYVRSTETLTGWSVALPESFAAFTASLASNTRRKVLNQREKLAGDFVEVKDAAGRDRAIAQLEQWVARRWGGPVAEWRARFHLDVVAGMGDARLTELRVGSTPVSVMLNLRAGGIEYYLQSGFDETHARGLSPGYLHLGYAIEAACRDGIRRFDFLAGRGLNRDYKQDFASASLALRTLQIVRNPSLSLLFRLADRLRRRPRID